MSKENSTEDPFIALSGTGTVTAEPDLAILSIGVEERAKTSSEAMQANSAALQKVFDIATEAGVAKSDIKTSNLSLQRLEHTKKSGERLFVGYQVTNMVTVQVRDLAKLGQVLDRMTRSGLNRIDRISFDTSRREELVIEARRAAADDIKARLALHQESFGFEVAGIQEIRDSSSTGSPEFLMAGGMRARSVDVPVSGGELEISVSITAKYRIS